MWWMIAAQAAGGLLSAAGDIEQGRQAWKAAKYNAETLRWEASLTREKAKKDAELIRDQGIRDVDAMRAGYAASGIAKDASVLEVLKDSARRVKRDELTIRYEGELQARMTEREAELTLMEGKAAKRASTYSAAGRLFGAGGQAGSTYMNFSKLRAG